jgi:DNA repair exonuclease SbcCD nuclease subunit
LTLRPRIRLLHTSDLHLGTDVDAYGPAWHGVECLCAIEIVAQAAIEAECDLLLIAGDLFDSNRVSDRLVGGLVRILSDLPLETVIVPGNHDAYDETSVYHRFERHTPSRTIQVMHDPDGRWAEFPQLGLSVWGRPIVVRIACPTRASRSRSLARGHGAWTL